MRSKAFPSILVVVLILSAFILTGCEKDPELPVLGGYFNNYWTSASGQVVRVMGYSEGHQAGSESVFQVQFDNPLQNAPTWTDNYRVVLRDPGNGNEWEAGRGEFIVGAWTATQLPVTVQFPQGVDGQLWLDVITAGGGGLGVQIRVGDAVTNGSPTTIR